ncbi:hypothetical protein FHS31_001597 [Sphingomonas vulcanisoli]|uniref:Capsular biosynthesis protein n=1 Tax=Sphingomonas vulcanisoli TaxID=1658060 RepID=A0ABX0TR29_9SPHN|nr:glycosyltransferase family 2 protein [Sphingomonas vulcanisoli]NIJ07987.1 hypothetical protein [Sphingomonas vulcanisoli]
MIVIPMAGLSRRFLEAGYEQPKYMLEAHGRTLFDHSVASFAAYFDTTPFLFVARDVMETGPFIAERCKALGIQDARITLLDAPTRGQAETVALGLQQGSVGADAPITIFNIDTFRPGFRFPDFLTDADGYLETFEGEGANWSFVRPVAEGSDRAAETSEKRPISRFCCTGLYHFARAGLFLDAFAAESRLDAGELQGGELYVAPMYNRLIAEGRDIRFTVIPREEVIFCGVPAEYDALLADPPAALG